MRIIKGFTLTELIITMMLIVILSLIAMPLYKGNFSNQAKIAEGYALLGTIRDAQFNYYNEYGNFLVQSESYGNNNGVSTFYDPVLGINAANNKYFTLFKYYSRKNGSSDDYHKYFSVSVYSDKAGTINRQFAMYGHYEAEVFNGNTNLSI